MNLLLIKYRLLMDLYLLSITAVVEGIETFSQTFNKEKVLFIF